jgi:hypothetical protein
MPTHLTDTELVSTITVTFMSEIPFGDDGCYAIQVFPPNEKLIASAVVNGTPLLRDPACPSLANPMPAFRAEAPHVGTITARIRFANLPEFLNHLTKPWQIQISSNSRLLREDVRGIDAWRNVRSAPWMRPVTLTAHAPSFEDNNFSVNFDDANLTIKTIVSQPRMISEYYDKVVFDILFPLSLIFVSGGGWLLLEFLWRLPRRREPPRAPRS